jgi:cytochrome c5
MRPALVNRSVLALSGALLFACVTFAWVVERPTAGTAPVVAVTRSPTPTSIEGSRLFQSRCERCHTLDEAQSPLRAAGTAPENRDAYLAFLQRHRKSEENENKPITDYLLSELDRPEGR